MYTHFQFPCRFVTTNREVKRLDSLAMSPIFGAFSETLQVRNLSSTRQTPHTPEQPPSDKDSKIDVCCLHMHRVEIGAGQL